MVISRVTSRVTILITHIRGLLTLLIATPEPPSRPYTPNPKHPCLYEADLWRLRRHGVQCDNGGESLGDWSEGFQV